MSKKQNRDKESPRDKFANKPSELGSAAWDIIKEIQENGLWKKFDEMGYFLDGKTHLPGTVFRKKMMDVARLARPDNPTPYMVEFVHIGQSSYLHLVKKPPRGILEAIIQKGAGHYTASNDIGGGMGTLGKTLPSKPVAPKTPAKMAEPVPEETPAKKPEPAIEQTPEQKKKAYLKKRADLVLARLKKRLEPKDPFAP